MLLEDFVVNGFKQIFKLLSKNNHDKICLTK